MMYGNKTTHDDDKTFYMWMPSRSNWEVVEPLNEIVEIRFPGFLIIKHKTLQDRRCEGMENLMKLLRFTVKSASY